MSSVIIGMVHRGLLEDVDTTESSCNPSLRTRSQACRTLCDQSGYSTIARRSFLSPASLDTSFHHHGMDVVCGRTRKSSTAIAVDTD